MEVIVMNIEEMRQIKEERGYSFKLLSSYTGVPTVTLQKIFSGKTANPRKVTMDAIERVLSASEAEYQGQAYAYSTSCVTPANQGKSDGAGDAGTSQAVDRSKDAGIDISIGAAVLREAAPAYIAKKQGEYTLEDYNALPDSERWELIDGVLIKMEAPRTVHQDIASIIHMAFYDHIRRTGKPCKVFEAPIDVQLDCDNRTMVEPDVLVVCDRDKIRGFGIYGAPDFILEILSRSTRKKDMTTKLGKYCEAGVREYWIIDPDKRMLITYNFMDEIFTPVIYLIENNMERSVPVAITGGELSIDLAPVAASIEELGSLE